MTGTPRPTSTAPGARQAAAGTGSPGGVRHDAAGSATFSASWPKRLSRLATWLVNKTAVHSHRRTAEAFAAAGGRRHHYALLASLEEFGPSSQADLGRRCGFDRSDVAALVNELAQAGYIERAQDPADRRRNIITVTGPGRERLAELDQLADVVQDELLAPLSPAERAELVRLLTLVLDNQAALHGPARETPDPCRD